MSVTRNIVRTYRGPASVVHDLLRDGMREDRLLAILMGACALIFVSELPRRAWQAHLEGSEFNMLMGGSLMAWMFIAPLLMYALAALARGVGSVFGGKGSMYGARLALFWALLATAPLKLLEGLVAGFIGAGPELQAVGLIWLGCFVWFWVSGSRVQEAGA